MELPISLNWRVLKTALRVLRSVIEYARLFIDVVKFKRLELTTLSELHILKSLNINDDTVRLSFSNCLLNLESV